MNYMLLIYSREDGWTPEEWRHCVETSTGICHQLAAKGQLRGASPLHPVATAATVRVRNGQTLVTDGPFAETSEQLGGYYIIDVEHLDEAIEIAAGLPPARKGTVEIRPLVALDGLPPERQPRPDGDGSLSKYMLLCYDDEAYWQAAGEEELRAARARAAALTRQLDEQGRFLSASPLHPALTATSVRVRQERREVTDGPFAETREILGGYYLVLARNREEALQVAARHPGVHVGAVEVREVFDVPEIPGPTM